MLFIVQCPSVPCQWKKSLITPLPKENKIEQLSDLRLVSVLPLLGKVIHKQIIEHLSNNTMLLYIQSTFRKNHNIS